MDSKSLDNFFGILQVMPILVLPMSLTTLVKLILYGAQKRCIVDILPLAMIELIQVFVWGTQGYFWIYMPPLKYTVG